HPLNNEASLHILDVPSTCRQASSSTVLWLLPLASPALQVKLLRVLPKTFDGKHVSDKSTKVYRAKKIRLELISDKETPCIYQVDGEVLGHIPAEISVAEKRLNVYIPKNYEEEVHQLQYDAW
ncbi:MAG: hypothetical protein ACFFD4_32715, partial [Candidatus Odinarchaeota archaeon]